jgi:hypothetical protein
MIVIDESVEMADIDIVDMVEMGRELMWLKRINILR